MTCRINGPQLLGWLCAAAFLAASAAEAACGGRPNVILIMTDDQGYGDLGVHGNPKISTPHLDKFAAESVEVEFFYVSPVCAPTRASLMTGRYNYRTGVTDTYLGRAMMHGDEVTIAEMLRAAGYRTGIFGKWHLGDCYPMRPGEQGFEESLVHRGGGLCQPAGPAKNSYFDPLLEHNGRSVKTKGYCSDVYTDAAIDFIAKHRQEPFFVYLPFNCPHGPYQIAEDYYRPYEQMNLQPGDFPAGGHPLGKIPGNTSRVYGMVTNIDDNLGRLFEQLDELGLRDDTIVIFLTDNGPNGARYNAGMRAHKGSVYEGGIRTAFFIRWPRRLTPGRKVDRIAAHVDIAPTILDACGVRRPAGTSFDGRSILPLLAGEEVAWPDRTLYFQWHRGDRPVRYRAFAARSQDYKLVHAAGVQPVQHGGLQDGADPADVPFELYDMAADPLETKNIAADHPRIVEKMRKGYEAWLAEVSRDHGYGAPRILIGTPHENPTVLTPQDWRSTAEGWGPKSLGHWELALPANGSFEITCRINPPKRPAVAHLKIQGIEVQQELAAGTGEYRFKTIRLSASSAERLETWVLEKGIERAYGARFVYVKRLD